MRVGTYIPEFMYPRFTKTGYFSGNPYRRYKFRHICVPTLLVNQRYEKITVFDIDYLLCV